MSGAGRSLVSGKLELAFAADADRRSYLHRQYASYPFHVCRVHYHDEDHPGLATLYVQSCSGGIYEDDRLDLMLAAARGAEAHVSTQAATVVHSMPSGSASQRVRIQCEGGSYLEYLPDPQILFPGSRCRSEIAIRLSGDAVALASDSFLTHDPAGGGDMFAAYFSEIVIENETGNARAIDRLKVEGQAFRELMPGDFRALRGAGNDDRRRSRFFCKCRCRRASQGQARSRRGGDRLLAAAELCRHIGQGARRGWCGA